MFKSKDGKMFNNPQIGAHRDKVMAQMRQPEEAPMQEPAGDAGEDIHGVVATHGPATEGHMRHEGDGFHVSTTHESGHVHEAMHHGLHEATEHLGAAFGGAEEHGMSEGEIQGGKMRSAMAPDSPNAPKKSQLIGL